MATKGKKKKKSKYNNGTRLLNKVKKLTRHLKKHGEDQDAKKALKKAQNG